MISKVFAILWNLMFTHFSLCSPVFLSLSNSYINKQMSKPIHLFSVLYAASDFPDHSALMTKNRIICKIL